MIVKQNYIRNLIGRKLSSGKYLYFLNNIDGWDNEMPRNIIMNLNNQN